MPDLAFNPERAYFNGTHGNHCCDERPEREGGDLVFEGWLGAPGVGQSWACRVCGESFWTPGSCGGSPSFVRFSDMDEPAELQPWDVV